MIFSRPLVLFPFALATSVACAAPSDSPHPALHDHLIVADGESGTSATEPVVETPVATEARRPAPATRAEPGEERGAEPGEERGGAPSPVLPIDLQLAAQAQALRNLEPAELRRVRAAAQALVDDDLVTRELIEFAWLVDRTAGRHAAEPALAEATWIDRATRQRLAALASTSRRRIDVLEALALHAPAAEAPLDREATHRRALAFAEFAQRREAGTVERDPYDLNSYADAELRRARGNVNRPLVGAYVENFPYYDALSTWERELRELGMAYVAAAETCDACNDTQRAAARAAGLDFEALAELIGNYPSGGC